MPYAALWARAFEDFGASFLFVGGSCVRLRTLGQCLHGSGFAVRPALYGIMVCLLEGQAFVRLSVDVVCAPWADFYAVRFAIRIQALLLEFLLILLRRATEPQVHDSFYIVLCEAFNAICCCMGKGVRRPWNIGFLFEDGWCARASPLPLGQCPCARTA